MPEEVFLLISRITPLVNVDLLIKNQQNQSLLTWRDDPYYSSGWHVPGGIVRFKEKIRDRIQAVALIELGASVEFRNEPLAINELIDPKRKIRGHFISILYECNLTSPPDEKLRYNNRIPKPGEWSWHSECPDNIIPIHNIYRNLINHHPIIGRARDIAGEF